MRRGLLFFYAIYMYFLVIDIKIAIGKYIIAKTIYKNILQASQHQINVVGLFWRRVYLDIITGPAAADAG